MTIEEMKERKRELGLSNEFLSRISGIPVPTIQKIFSGKTRSPRLATVKALETVLADYGPKHLTADGFFYELPARQARVSEAQAAYAIRKPEQERLYSVEDIYALPDGIRAELIDGRIYYMATPTKNHQEINGELYLAVANYIRSHGGGCKVFIPPFAVRLFADDSNHVEPDLTVVCNPDKLDERGCVGAPDWVVEILSPSSVKMDCFIKLIKYRVAGVREYWIVDPESRTIVTYELSSGAEQIVTGTYSFDDEVPGSLYPDFRIRLSDVL